MTIMTVCAMAAESNRMIFRRLEQYAPESWKKSMTIGRFNESYVYYVVGKVSRHKILANQMWRAIQQIIICVTNYG